MFHGHSHGAAVPSEEELRRNTDLAAVEMDDKATLLTGGGAAGGGHGHSHGGGHGHSHGNVRAQFGVLARLFRLARAEGWLLLGGLVGLIGSTAINVLMPYTLGTILTDGVADGSFNAVLRVTGIFLVVYVIGSLMTVMRVACFAVAGERVARTLRTRLFASLLAQPLAFFDGHRSGELVNRLSADCDLIRVTLTTTVVVMGRFILQLVGGSAFLFFLSWRLTLVMLSVTPPLALAGWLYSRRARRLGSTIQTALANNTATASEVLSGVRHVRAFGREAWENKRYVALLARAYSLGRTLGLANAIFMGGSEFAGYAAVLLVILYGTYLLIQGQLSIEFVTTYVLYAVYVAHAMGALSHQGAELARAAGASERVFDLLELLGAPLPARGGVAVAPTLELDLMERGSGGGVVGAPHAALRGDVAFSSVTFAYPTRVNQPASLRGASFTVREGQRIAIVGPSGAGKSTILQLLLKFYDGYEGTITIGGEDIRTMDSTWLRQQVGFVSQEPTLFAYSILENIMYGRPDASFDDVCNAARAALIHDFIISLPDGYNTIVGDRGALLSGGQRQRIAIARVFLKNAPLVLLDEPTSALDKENEQLVEQAIQRLFANRTCVVVSHSARLLANVDAALVLQDGAVSAVGAPDALATSNDTFRRLFESHLPPPV